MMQKSITQNFEEIFERIKRETDIKSLRQLAKIIGKDQSTISSAKAKDNFPANWAFEIEKKYEILTRWIMTGEGPKRLNEAIEINPLLVDVNEWLNEEKKEKDAGFKILFEQQMVRAFFDYEKWIRKRDEQENSESISLGKKIAY